MKKRLLSSDETYLRLRRRDEFQKFFRGLIKFLQKKLRKVEIEGEHYYTCGQPHENYNNNWEPFQNFQNLWNYTEKRGLDFYASRDRIQEELYKELVCECQIFGDYEKVRQKELEQMGIYFGEPERREVEIVSGLDLTKIDRGLF